jgi:hypothetical protein
MYIKYLNFPQVPEELLDSFEDIIAKTSELLPKTPQRQKEQLEYFQNKAIGQELDQWLHGIFKFKFYAKYQIIYRGIPIHTDKGAYEGDRKYAINYLLDLGGTNVITTVYDDDMKTVLQSECLELKRWHTIQVEKFHGVEGIEPEKLRIALSVTPLLNI